MPRNELLDADRGAEDVDLDDLMGAARRVAMAENVAVFHGWPRPASSGSPAPRHKTRSSSERIRRTIRARLQKPSSTSSKQV